MCKKKKLYITLTTHAWQLQNKTNTMRTWGLPLEEKGPNIQKKNVPWLNISTVLLK